MNTEALKKQGEVTGRKNGRKTDRDAKGEVGDREILAVWGGGGQDLRWLNYAGSFWHLGISNWQY